MLPDGKKVHMPYVPLEYLPNLTKMLIDVLSNVPKPEKKPELEVISGSEGSVANGSS